MSSEPISPCCGCDSISIDLATPPPYMPMAFTVMSVSGFSTASASQSPSCAPASASALPRRRRLGGSAPPSVMDIITEISAMPSPMQWCTRATSAEPPS